MKLLLLYGPPAVGKLKPLNRSLRTTVYQHNLPTQWS
jgi:hypothetical protein